MGFNVAQLVRQWALRTPEQPAIVLDEPAPAEVTYAELDARALRVAAQLARHGLGPGSRLALSAANTLHFVETWFGGLYAGCTLLPLPPMSAPRELAHRLGHARCDAVVFDASTAELVSQALADAPRLKRLAAETLADEPGEHPGPVDLHTGAAAMILYTSGTTGVAKGAVISHASLLSHTAALVHHVLGLQAEDVVLATLPLTHSYGIRMTLLAPFYAGATSVLLPRFGVDPVLSALADEAVTWFPGVPTMFHALANAPDLPGCDFPNLRWCLSAGAPLPRSVREAAERRLGTRVRQGYGLTEATFSTVASPSDPDAADTVGRPVFGCEVQVVDEQEKPLGPGEPGEVCVRGQNVMTGYLDDPDATREALRGGWLHTGDLGVLDASGRLSIVDRLKDLILRGGFNVYPAEVEAALVAHPAIREALVVGVPDERYGEDVAAVLVLSEPKALTDAELSSHCRKHLARPKLPRQVGFLDALPVGASGKVQRRAVHAMLKEGTLTLRPILPAPAYIGPA